MQPDAGAPAAAGGVSAKTRRNAKKHLKQKTRRRERLEAKKEKARQRAQAEAAAAQPPAPETGGVLQPATPTHSQQGDGGAVRPCDFAEEHTSAAAAQQPAAAVCRADLSGAVLGFLGRAAAAGGSPQAGQKRRAPAGRLAEFVSGNYKDYYKHRLPADGRDPRLQAMAKHLFAGRHCLDIGCNEGVFTLALVAEFQPASMLGLDLDEQLIKRACVRLRSERAQLAEAQQHRSKASARHANSLAHTWFQAGSFLSAHLEGRAFDTITCMSVTKWVHLQGGDAALRAFFAKVAALLRPGGLFVLEPQPWRSYKPAAAKLNKAGMAHVPPGSLQLRPDAFPDWLARELGFALLRTCSVRQPAKGFDRPIYWLQKPRS